MYLVKKISQNGYVYYVLVINTGFFNEGKPVKEFININEDLAMRLIVKNNIKVFDNEVK